MMMFVTIAITATVSIMSRLLNSEMDGRPIMDGNDPALDF